VRIEKYPDPEEDHHVQRPDSLPAQLFLLAVDPARRRLTGRGELGFVLRAAALVDLQLSGHLVDDGGRPKAPGMPGPSDPVLDPILAQVAAAPRRRWAYWVRKDARETVRWVRQQLVAGRRIELEPHRILGVLPARRIIVLDPFARDRIVGAIDAALGDGWPVGERTAALVALAAAGGMRTVLPPSRRRAHRKRLAELTARSGPVPTVLRKVLRGHRAGAAAAVG
jgi:hypothetical protein